jgi:hypothetical protein
MGGAYKRGALRLGLSAGGSNLTGSWRWHDGRNEEVQTNGAGDGAQQETKMNGLEIEKVLVVSTAHLPAEHKFLDNTDGVSIDTFGWTVRVKFRQYPALKQIFELLSFAAGQGCAAVRFDQDADTLPEFETWRW